MNGELLVNFIQDHDSVILIGKYKH